MKGIINMNNSFTMKNNNNIIIKFLIMALLIVMFLFNAFLADNYRVIC